MKVRLVIGAALAVGGCGSTDDRPRTLEYITDTILAPTCALAECHSAFKMEVGDQFDTAEAARRSMVANSLLVYSSNEGPAGSTLIKSMTVGVPSLLERNLTVRMPYDAPMPDADIALMEAWIAEGARGAQCVANDAGNGCSVTTVGTGTGAVTTYQVVKCVDGNIGDLVMDCPGKTVCAYVTGNGQCK
jgi:hypothetical protein